MEGLVAARQEVCCKKASDETTIQPISIRLLVHVTSESDWRLFLIVFVRSTSALVPRTVMGERSVELAFAHMWFRSGTNIQAQWF